MGIIFKRVVHDRYMEKWLQALDAYRTSIYRHQTADTNGVYIDLHNAFCECIVAYTELIIRNSDTPDKPIPTTSHDCISVIKHEMRKRNGRKFEEFELLDKPNVRLCFSRTQPELKELEIMEEEIDNLNHIAHRQKVYFEGTENEHH